MEKVGQAKLWRALATQLKSLDFNFVFTSEPLQGLECRNQMIKWLLWTGVKVWSGRAVMRVTRSEVRVWAWVVALKSERDQCKLYYEERIDRTEWRYRCQRQHEVLHPW